MATSKIEIKKLVTRLVQLPAQDTSMLDVQSSDIRESLGKALERWAKSDEHAARMTDWLVFDRPPDQRKWRPTPGEIRDASEAVPAQPPTGETCVICDGTGGLTRGLVTWQETGPGGIARRCREIVSDEQEAHRVAAEKPAGSGAMGTSCSIDCKCRKVPVSA